MVITSFKKGQMKIQQMIFMLLAVFLFFILIGLFFLTTSLNNLKQTATQLEEKNALLLVSKLADSPEFSCGNSFGTSMSSCIDFEKIMNLKDMKEYSDFWGVAKIEVRIIYPAGGNALCTASNYPNCEIIQILNKNINSGPYNSNFVSLCREDSNGEIIYPKCELALLMVSSEIKG